MKVLDHSFARFVYPLLFDASTFAARRRQIDDASYDSGKPLWQAKAFPTDEMLPHVAKYLNPRDGTDPTALLRQMHPQAMQSQAGLGANKNTQWQFVMHSRKEHHHDEHAARDQANEPNAGKFATGVPFETCDVQLALFRVGVGFLSFQVKLASDRWEDWLDFLHFFRRIRSDKRGVLAMRRTGFNREKQEPIHDYYRPALAASDLPPETPWPFAEIVYGLLRTATLATESDAWWQEIFVPRQMLPYAALFLKDVPEADDGQILYRIHNFFRAEQVIDPAPEDLSLNQSHLLPYARRQWWVLSLDGGAFVACDPPDTEFFRKALPPHINEEYFILYLLALHQRFALMGLSDDVSRNWLRSDGPDTHATDEIREEVFRRIRGTMLTFTASGYFAQVMQRRHHHRCYWGWLEVFQVERLYDEVSREVHDMHEYLLMRKTARLEQLALGLNVIAAVGIPSALILSVLDAVGGVTWPTALVATLAGLTFGGFLAACLFRDRVRVWLRWTRKR